MKTLFSYLINIFSYVFWVFRIIITLMLSLKIYIPIAITNINYEIIFLFITLAILLLVTKRKLIGGMLYFALYTTYFGYEIYSLLAVNSLEAYYAIFMGAIGILISFANMLDLLTNKNRGNISKKTVQKTDWFYQNKEFDRKLDERADKNNYRLI